MYSSLNPFVLFRNWQWSQSLLVTLDARTHTHTHTGCHKVTKRLSTICLPLPLLKYVVDGGNQWSRWLIPAWSLRPAPLFNFCLFQLEIHELDNTVVLRRKWVGEQNVLQHGAKGRRASSEGCRSGRPMTMRFTYQSKCVCDDFDTSADIHREREMSRWLSLITFVELSFWLPTDAHDFMICSKTFAKCFVLFNKQPKKQRCPVSYFKRK